MAQERERSGQDRRRQPRGGRRPADVDGLSPLVMLVGPQGEVMGLAEAVLAKLRFAVSPVATADDALRVLPTLRPDIVVADQEDAARIRREAPEHLSVVTLTPSMEEDPNLLIEDIRQSIRANATSTRERAMIDPL